MFSILKLIVDVAAGLLGGVLLLRFWMQAIRVRPPSSVAQFTFQLSDWLVRPLGIEKVRSQAEAMEVQAGRFYREAAKRTTDAAIRELLGSLAAEEVAHENLAKRLGIKYLPEEALRKMQSGIIRSV